MFVKLPDKPKFVYLIAVMAILKLLLGNSLGLDPFFQERVERVPRAPDKPQFIYIKPSDLTCLYQKKQTAPTIYSLRPISSERLKKK